MKFFIVETDVTASFNFCVEAENPEEARALARDAGAAAIRGGPIALDISTYDVRESDEK